jgi:hypothetical protein
MVQQYQQNNINSPRGSRSVSTSGVLNFDDDLVVASTVAAPISLTLPIASQIPGEAITIKANDAGTTGNSVTIAAGPGQDIDGAASATLTTDQEFLTVESDGTNWRVVSSSSSSSAQNSAPHPAGDTSLGPGSLAGAYNIGEITGGAILITGVAMDLITGVSVVKTTGPGPGSAVVTLGPVAPTSATITYTGGTAIGSQAYAIEFTTSLGTTVVVPSPMFIVAGV